MTQTLEKIPSSSPLLSSPVIEKDYTKGIDTQLDDGAAQGAATTHAPEPEPTPQPTPGPSQEFKHQFDADGPKGFNFEEPVDGSDVSEEDLPGFELSGTSAKAFANMLGDLFKIYVPQLTYSYIKVDENSVRIHVSNGNMRQGMEEVFRQVNENTFQSLQFEEDEIKMFKKTTKEYLEYKNLQIANPENAFWIMLLTLLTTHGIKVYQGRNQNVDLLRQAIMSYNPDYFESFKVKEEKPSEEQKEESKEPKKKL